MMSEQYKIFRELGTEIKNDFKNSVYSGSEYFDLSYYTIEEIFLYIQRIYSILYTSWPGDSFEYLLNNENIINKTDKPVSDTFNINNDSVNAHKKYSKIKMSQNNLYNKKEDIDNFPGTSGLSEDFNDYSSHNEPEVNLSLDENTINNDKTILESLPGGKNYSNRIGFSSTGTLKDLAKTINSDSKRVNSKPVRKDTGLKSILKNNEYDNKMLKKLEVQDNDSLLQDISSEQNRAYDIPNNNVNNFIPGKKTFNLFNQSIEMFNRYIHGDYILNKFGFGNNNIMVTSKKNAETIDLPKIINDEPGHPGKINEIENYSSEISGDYDAILNAIKEEIEKEYRTFYGDI